jgi:rhamnulokinase
VHSVTQYMAVDLGASNGRVLAAGWDGNRFALREVHRFDNVPVTVMGHLYWDALRLWGEVKTGISRHMTMTHGSVSGLGVDSWGVDFALLDRDGRLLGNPYHYRDPRTDGVMDEGLRRLPRSSLYKATGIQIMQINTLFQLYSMVRARDAQLAAADVLLPIPNLFNYWLSGTQAAEYTHATTTQCLDVRERRWATELLATLEIPLGILPSLVEAGTVLGPLRPDVAAEVGLSSPAPVVAVGCHDTASAVAAIAGLDSQSVYISSGTWSLMGVERQAPIVTERALESGFTNEGGVGGTIRLLKNITGLWLVQECRRQWQREGANYTWDELLVAAERAESFRSLVDPDAQDFLSPPDMPAAIRDACIRSGQPAPESVGQIVRCCLESLAVRYRATLEDLEALVEHPLDAIHVVGGGSQNRLLCQLTADACERPVEAGPVEAAALGNIMVQAIATGELASISDGRSAVGGSVKRTSYEPRPGGAWREGVARLRSAQGAMA